MIKLMPKLMKTLVASWLISLPLVISLLVSLVSPLQAKVYDFAEDNKLTLLQDARAAVELKLEMVRHAKHHIHIMTYYMDNNGYPIELMKELNIAHARGVDVRIITTFIPSVTMDFFAKSKRTLYKNDDKKSKAVLSYLKMIPGNNEAITNNIHEKIFLVDGEKAILGGRNISDNDFRAKDLEVMLEGPVVNQVQKHFEKMFSFMIMLKIKHKCSDTNPECADKLNKTKFSEKDRGFYPEQPRFPNGIKARILTNEILIQQYENDYWGEERFFAKDDIIETIVKIEFNKLRAYNYFILPTKRYKLYLEKNLAEGKSIEMITNSMATAKSISDKGYLYGLPEMHNLVERGLQLYQWLGSEPEQGQDKLFYLHEKVMLFDDDHGVIGSHNFGSGSTSVSSEIAIEFYSKPVVKTLIDVFDAEKTSELKTARASLPSIENEIKPNSEMIKFLHMFFVRNFVREMF
jgi:putative cardiolipin synthase